MTLQAETGETNAVQLGLFSPQMPEPARLDVTTARIRAIVGEDRVGCPELKDTHEPDAFLVKEFSLAAAARDRPARPVRPISALRRLRPSERVMMTLRNYDPHHFYFRGACYEVEKGYGPWRVAGGWWAQNGWSLEEWDIVARVRDKSASNSTNKLLCCLITRNTFNDQWHVEAVYD
jgi:protein ImuB